MYLHYSGVSWTAKRFDVTGRASFIFFTGGYTGFLSFPPLGKLILKIWKIMKSIFRNVIYYSWKSFHINTGTNWHFLLNSWFHKCIVFTFYRHEYFCSHTKIKFLLVQNPRYEYKYLLTWLFFDNYMPSVKKYLILKWEQFQKNSSSNAECTIS